MGIINSILIAFILIVLILTGCKSRNKSGETEPQSRRQKIDALYSDYDQKFREYLANASRELGKEVIELEPLSDCCTVPKKITITGTPYEIGFTIGHIAAQFNRNPQRVTEKNMTLNRQIAGMYEDVYPQYLEIVRGIAAAADMPFEQVDLIYMEYTFFLNLWLDLLRYGEFFSLTDFGRYGDVVPGHSCSVASYYTGDRHIVGRNFDNPSDRPHYFAVTNMEGVNKMMGNVIYFLYHWVVDGINEKGLSINVAQNSGEYNVQETYPGEPAIFAGHMARIVMDTCADVDEAVRLIGSVRVWFPGEGVHWLIADASGKAVIVEFDLNKKMVVLDKTGPYELITNTTLQKGEEFAVNNCRRYAAAKPMLENGIETTGDMLDIMKAVRQTSGDSRTLWTSIMDLNNRSFEVFYRKEYSKKYSFSF